MSVLYSECNTSAASSPCASAISSIFASRSLVSSLSHLSASHQSVSAPILGSTLAACRLMNFCSMLSMLFCSASVAWPFIRISAADLARILMICPFCVSSLSSTGGLSTPLLRFNGTISSSAPSIGGRLLSALASFRVIYGAPTAACRIAARSSNEPLSFSVRSNSTYKSFSSSTIGIRKLLNLCCSIWIRGPRHSAYRALALSLELAYVCVSLCHTSEGFMPYAAATLSRDSLTDSAHCDSLKDVENGLISIPSSSRGIEPAFSPPAPQPSRNAVTNLFRASSSHGCTSFGLTI